MKNRKQQPQVTCICSAYSFPHRIGGGLCIGSQWADSYKNVYGEYCTSCNCYAENDCEVVNGAEDIKECEAYRWYLHYGIHEKLPIDVQEVFDEAYNSYYEREDDE